MTQKPESLLESDRLDEVLEGSGPPPGVEIPDGSAPPTPVVVVPYGNMARSWLPFVALIAALTLGGLLAASWRETRRLRVQALQARRALERAIEKARAVELELQWMAAGRPAVAMTPPPPTPTEVRPDPAPAGTATATPETSGAPAAAYIGRGNAGWIKKQYDWALAEYSAALGLDPGQADAYNNRAWVWATCPDAKHRDGKQAVASATRACELSGWKEAAHIGSLAAASAEAGDFEAAVTWQSRANELYADAGEEKKGEERLRLYRVTRTYRETPP